MNTTINNDKIIFKFCIVKVSVVKQLFSNHKSKIVFKKNGKFSNFK